MVLQHVTEMGRQELLPEDHMADKAVLALHDKQAAQVTPGKIEFGQPAQHDDLEAGVPPELKGILLG